MAAAHPPSFVVMLPGGELCITDNTTHHLHCLTLAGDFKRELGEASVQFAMGLASDGESLFVADGFSNCIVKLRLADGVQTGRADNLEYPHALAYAGGTLFCADWGNHRVVAYDSALRPLFTIGGDGSPALGVAAPGSFMYPRGLVTHEDELYVADTDNHRIQGVPRPVPPSCVHVACVHGRGRGRKEVLGHGSHSCTRAAAP